MTQLLVLQWTSISEEEEEYMNYIVRRNWLKYCQIILFFFLFNYNKYKKDQGWLRKKEAVHVFDQIL